ncbi:SH3 domain-containing protein [Gemmatimonadota bacterium]
MALVPAIRVRPAIRHLSTIAVAAGTLTGGCAKPPPPPPALPSDPGPPPQQVVVPDPRLSAEVEALRQQVTELEFRLLEKEVQVAEIEDKLADAIQEVVRANAKLHSVESRAEAASTIAEAEVGMRALRAAAGSDARGPEFAQAEQLLEMSAAEFDNENYGGSLYLSNQAKSLIALAQGRLTGENLPFLAGEMLFAVPIPLEVTGTSNIREGPGTSFKVLFLVTRGTALTGQAYKDQWVRISDDEGRTGWIHYTLVKSRPERSR